MVLWCSAGGVGYSIYNCILTRFVIVVVDFKYSFRIFG